MAHATDTVHSIPGTLIPRRRQVVVGLARHRLLGVVVQPLHGRPLLQPLRPRLPQARLQLGAGPAGPGRPGSVRAGARSGSGAEAGAWSRRHVRGADSTRCMGQGQLRAPAQQRLPCTWRRAAPALRAPARQRPRPCSILCATAAAPQRPRDVGGVLYIPWHLAGADGGQLSAPVALRVSRARKACASPSPSHYEDGASRDSLGEGEGGGGGTRKGRWRRWRRVSSRGPCTHTAVQGRCAGPLSAALDGPTSVRPSTLRWR
jgi:hypothetical protein